MLDITQFFDGYYNNAEVNSLLIFDINGFILDANKSFTNHFGYNAGELTGRHFSMLFNQQDIHDKKPELELQEVLARGQAQDENYVVDKTGQQIFCTGESVLVSTRQGERYIIKDIVNLQSKKQIQLFLKDTDELLQQMFSYSKGIAMMILDTSLKVQEVNDDFLKLFSLPQRPAAGTRISNIGHSFWHSTALRDAITLALVHSQPMANRDFDFVTEQGEKAVLRIDSKLIAQTHGTERKLFILIQQMPSA